MRSASSLFCPAMSLSNWPKPAWVDWLRRRASRLVSLSGTLIFDADRRRFPPEKNAALFTNVSRSAGGSVAPSHLSHSIPSPNFQSAAVFANLFGSHDPGMVVLVPSHRQTVALDRVAKEQRWIAGFGRLRHGLVETCKVMSAEIAHQFGQIVVASAFKQRVDVALISEILEQPAAPGGPSLKSQRRIKLVRAVVDPFAQSVATWFAEGRFLQLAILENDNIPAKAAEHVLNSLPEPLAERRRPSDWRL